MAGHTKKKKEFKRIKFKTITTENQTTVDLKIHLKKS